MTERDKVEQAELGRSGSQRDSNARDAVAEAKRNAK